MSRGSLGSFKNDSEIGEFSNPSLLQDKIGGSGGHFFATMGSGVTGSFGAQERNSLNGPRVQSRNSFQKAAESR